jgi:serine/threonine-protein kinase
MAPTTTDRDTFLNRLRKSGLLSEQQFADVSVRLGDVRGSAELARALVRMRRLTRFQARMLLKGRTSGFFLGPYRILEQVGHGGMGKVYKAMHTTMDRTVALKVLSPSLVKTPKARAMFRQEVQTAAKLCHPNIVTAYDANETDGRHFLAMEFIAGATLSQIVHQRGPMPIGLACEVIRQAALGLQHAHEHGLVHRDIKPANIMVSVVRNPLAVANGPGAAAGSPRSADEVLQMLRLQVKILDFGLARLHRRKKDTATDGSEVGRQPITGTPDFMSPEQAKDRNAVDIRSDLYSLGCTFYYLLTGQVPFPGSGMLDKLIRHHSEAPPAPDKLRPKIPAAVAAIVLQLLNKDPADRFQTPRELADALSPHASSRSLNRGSRRLPRLEPEHARTPRLEEKTLGLDHAETPRSIGPISRRAEREAVSAWVEMQVRQRRRRSIALWIAAAAAVGVGVTAGILAFQPW